MNRRIYIILISLGTTFLVYFSLVLIFRDTVKEYGAVISSVSTFLYLIFNCMIVYINLNSLNNNTRPFVIVAFETFEDGQGCFTVKNIGNSAAIVKSVEIDTKWLERYFGYFPALAESEKKFMRELKDTHIVLAPKIKVIFKMKFDPQTVVDTQLSNSVSVNLRFTNASRQRFYKKIVFDFSQYSEMCEYESSSVSHKGIATGQIIE